MSWLNIIADQVHLAMLRINLNDDATFHKIICPTIVLVLYKTGLRNMKNLLCLDSSHMPQDLNLTEHLQDEVERAIRDLDSNSSNLTFGKCYS